MQVVTDFGRGVQVVHFDWRVDSEAVAKPWGVRVGGVVVTRRETVGDAGSFARAIAEQSGQTIAERS